jgi:hypothetical protein
MKFKTLFLSTALLATAALFSYCSKETITETPAPVATDSGAEATSRGICKVNIEAINCTVDVCGTQTSASVCGTSGFGNLFGSETIVIGGNQTFLLSTPTVLKVSRNPGSVSAFFSSIKVNASGGASAVYSVPVTGTVDVNVGDLCNLF